MRKQNIRIPEHKEGVDSLRPILKAARQKSMNGGPNLGSKKDLDERFSFEDAKFGTKSQFLDGSTRNICSSEMILNSRMDFLITLFKLSYSAHNAYLLKVNF